ncbi:MAG: PEP/pyruvate-binding domain-containing protein [Syntrophobacteraceae bacterium]
MSFIRKYLEKLGITKKGDSLTPSDPESLRTAFQARYHNFKLLLNANNKALQIMSEIEEAQKGDRPFGMSFIRANCTAVSVNVFRMIKSMEELAPGKYRDLFDRFRAIQGAITEELSVKREAESGPFIIGLDEIDKARADEAGNKMANLGEIRNRLGLRVPNGFTITSHAFREFIRSGDLQSEIDRLLQSSPAEEMDQLFSLSGQIQQLIIRTHVPEALDAAIRSAYQSLEETDGAGVKISMRSSALAEDSSETSFAGQYRSELNVAAENIIQAYKEIAASKYSLQAIMYRLNKGIRDEDIDMCVGCMSMVSAVAGGVIYTRNPLNVRDDRVFVHSVWGLPKSVVDGSVSADLFAVSRSAPLRVVEKHISEKRQKFVCYPDEGVCRLEIIDDVGSAPSISDERAIELARVALLIEDHYNCAQDVEWAVDDKRDIYILQCRPLRQTGNIIESGRLAEQAPAGEVIVAGGIAAGSGAGYGPVFVLRRESDALLFAKGGVLVIKQALPRWAALLSRAAALVAEQGTAAGHLANVAREFGVPALFGVENATDLLENGETVTVDAEGLRIYKGRIESLLENAEARRRLMEGSPVFETLKKVSEKIVPLHLIDPESPDFKPGRCGTFHDITRFCHEKSVKEMFSFGRDHHFSERASRQLFCDIPMQWWVLNLDDGFREEAPGKFVLLENIVSIPMLALWEGIIAVPWEGPPPVDSKGFMSILLEASSNPALDPSMPSPYSNRNYFMISRNFCSLSSRFGFHFSTIEALVGERANENYISFSFKGGAADAARRVRRARFVSEILEEFEFRSEVKEDGVLARLEGYDEDVMKEKLRILGYLLIHTRQLDMVMFNDASCQLHKQKLIMDISSVVLGRCPIVLPPGD